MPWRSVDRRQKLLVLAVSVAIIGTATLYLISSSMENQDEVLDVRTVLKNPQKYLNEDITVRGNISGIKHYGNTTVFYLKEGNYSLRCISFGNMSLEEGNATVKGKLHYNEEWGVYELEVSEVNPS